MFQKIRLGLTKNLKLTYFCGRCAQSVGIAVPRLTLFDICISNTGKKCEENTTTFNTITKRRSSFSFQKYVVPYKN